MMVVFAVLNVVRAEAWVKRREEDSVAVLEEGAGCCLYVCNNYRRRKRMMMISYNKMEGEERKLGLVGFGVTSRNDDWIGNSSHVPGQ